MDALLNTLSYVLWVGLALGILVFVHELGHFLAARLFGMRVDAFSLGFPPNVFRKQIGETEYRLGAIPLGGYVKIAGMVDESLDVDGLESEPQSDEYRSKPVWQRMIVISAGVIFNVILAALLYSALAFSYGRTYTPAENVRLKVFPESVAAQLGLETGDRIVGVNGEPVEIFEDVFSPEVFAADPLRLTVLRENARVELEGPESLLSKLSRRQQELEAAGAPTSFEAVFGAAPQYPPILVDVSPGSAAAAAGLQAGDRVMSIDGVYLDTWYDMSAAVAATEGRSVTIRWARPDSLDDGQASAALVERRGAAAIYEAEVTARPSGNTYLLGVVGGGGVSLGTRTVSLGPGAAIAAGVDKTAAMLGLYASFVGKLVSGKESVRDNVGGPLMIAKQSKEAADQGAKSFWEFVALLSIALAVFNVLPIPALDGGHLVFLAYEGVVRREPSLKVRMVVQQVGVALILALMVFVIFNDAVRWFG